MSKKYNTVAIIGGGVMGTVLARSIVSSSESRNILICERDKSQHKRLKKISSLISVTSDVRDCSDVDVLFLAVKPQDFAGLGISVKENVLVCSIMAGVSISEISKVLNTQKVVRMMPNLGARVNQSFTSWTTSKKVSIEEKKWVKNFLNSFGTELYVNNEDKINKSTAVSGSGPAYLFFILSIFVDAAKDLGFKEKEARSMVQQVLRGVNSLSNENTDFKELAKQVTSKGGTTEAALKVFSENKTEDIWLKAVRVAYLRALELSKK